MKSCIFGLLISLAQISWAQDTWIHVNGRSFHDSGYYRQWNPGLGIERKINNDKDWTWAAGWYQNSIDRITTYSSVKRMWRLDDTWQININMGGVTGYRGWTVAPVILPEACYGWVCGFFIPKLNHENTAAAAFYLRIPIK